MTAETCDVIVIGLGPAGARAAAAAAARGCRVIALDRRRRAGVPVQCAELVPGLIGQDVAGVAPCTAQAVTRMTTTIGSAAADETTPFPGYIIDRARFDREQVEAAAAAGAACRFGSAVRRAAIGVVTLADGCRLQAPVVIGADGPYSALGRALGAINRTLIHARQVTVPLTTAHDATDIFLRASLPGGYGWLFPKGGLAHVGIGVAAVARRELKTLLAGLHAELVAAGRVGTRVLATTGGAIPAGGRLRPHAADGERLALLAGDAAGLTNPITGAGIHAALVSGELAGSTAADWLAGDREAPVEYAAEIEDLFGASIDRALARRHALARTAAPGRADFERAWVAYPQYWNEARAAAPAEEALA